jgi:CspA family cold shock protein
MSSPKTPDVSQPTFTQPTSTSMTNGRVKWFNNKAGYGFITVSVGDNVGTDVFVHHSAIEVSQEQYRYLVQGEYVEFTLCQVENDVHKWQAGSVKGVNNGKLMCETRMETREQRMTHNTDEEPYSRPPRQESSNRDPSYRIRSRGPGPREGDEWMLVRRRPPRQGGPQTSQTSQTQQTSQPRDVLRQRQPRN